jgi:hypothetical protein
MSSQEQSVVTREMAFAEADRLKAAGIEPSNRKLLQELGGSMSTIAKFLREWRAKPPEAVALTEAIEVPAAVMEAGNLAVAAIWRACHAEARLEVAAVTALADQRVKDAEEERDREVEELGEAVADLTAERSKAADLLATLETLRGEHTTMLSQTASRESASAATIEQMGHQIEAQAAELVRVHADHEQARQAHADALRLAHAEIAEVRAKMAEEGAKLALALDQERDISKKLSAADSENKLLAGQLNDAHVRYAADVKKVEAELAAQRKDASESMRQLAAITGECEALRAQVKSQLVVINNMTTKTDHTPAQAADNSSKSKTFAKKRQIG